MPSGGRSFYFNQENGESYYIPFLAFNDAATKIKNEFGVGSQVFIKGRMQSREYQKQTSSGIEKRMTYELYVSQIKPYIRLDQNEKDSEKGKI